MKTRWWDNEKFEETKMKIREYRKELEKEDPEEYEKICRQIGR